MTDIAFSMTSDEKDVVRGLQSIGKEQAKLRDQIGGLVAASKEAGAAENNIAQQRIAGLSAVVEKQKALRSQTDALAQQLREGKITADQYKASFDGISKESNQLTTELRQLQAQVAEDSADLKKASVIIGQVEDKTEKYSRAVAELNRLKEKGILTTKQHTAAVAAESAKLNESEASASTSVGGFTQRLVAMTAGGVGAVAFIQQMAGKLGELREEMAGNVQEFDRLSRKLGIQGGLSDAERKAQSRMVGKVAYDAAVPIDKAFETATQLSSSGFEDPVKNGTLNTALALMQSSNQIEGDAAGFIKGSGQFMQAFGMRKDQKNLADLGIRMQGLFKSTDVQAADLPEFAKAAPVLSGAGLTLEQSLSTLTALRETMNAGEAATGARNVVSILQTAGTKAPATQALASIGLKPQQVDIQGEGLPGALNTLKQAMGGLGEAERAGVMAQIFGMENSAAASILMNSTGKFDRYAQMQRGAAVGFQADVTTARTGAFAAATRSDVTRQMDSMRQEDYVNEQELMRQARINIRERAAMANASTGTFTGRMKAGQSKIHGVIEDNVIAPLTGEWVLGNAHAKEIEMLKNEGPGAVPINVQMPDELRQALVENNKLLAQQLEAQQRNAEAVKHNQHAGIVAGRRNAQMEGGR